MSFDGLIGGGVNQYAPSTYVEKTAMCRQPTLQERLDLAVEQAEERLKSVKEARDIFARNPDIERLLNLMQGGHF